MVKICDNIYEGNEHEEIFQTYPFELSAFQKHAINAIENGKHVLITAHTGSGKTLPAAYAIQKFCKLGKKVIYTSPIKALSNQKFNEFTKKFPEISFGIITGDIKFNPEADCVIMTTEILRNNLFNKKTCEQGIEQPLQFEMDIENELACVIFDEIHYINDKERGKIWEETIMMLPENVLIVMLSATINKSENFAKWIEDIKQQEVYLASTNKRIVPLTHYSYLTLRNKLTERYGKNNNFIDTKLNQLIPLKKPGGFFLEENFFPISKNEKFFEKNNIFVNKEFVLNNITKYLKEHNLLPAICFVFSRRKTEEFANKISLSLNDSRLMNIIPKECKKLLINKIPNWKEYVKLPEFEQLVQLLQKGIAVHHSGVIPVFKEIIEIMFERGYVKLLFATETFAVGVNMPTKTVLFTGLKKFDGNKFRFLLPHEYTQMAGRAGRRGLDKKGTVIHLNNMFQIPTCVEYKNILCGLSQTITSKFQINFNLILNLIANNKTDFDSFINLSMMKISVENEKENIIKHIQVLQERHDTKIELLEFCRTPVNILKEYAQLLNGLEFSDRKRKKQIIKNIKTYQNQHKFIDDEVNQILELQKINKEIFNLQIEHKETSNYISQNIKTVLGILLDFGFITSELELTSRGIIGANIQETHSLVTAELFDRKNIDDLTAIELICIFSCIANVPIPEDRRSPNVWNKKIPEKAKLIIDKIFNFYNEIHDVELQYNLECKNENLQYELCELIYAWSLAETELTCKQIFQLAKERGKSVGVFVKAILKINNIASEFEKVCEIQSNLKLLEQIKKIPQLTLKSVVTNQSLYI